MAKEIQATCVNCNMGKKAQFDALAALGMALHGRAMPWDWLTTL